MGTDSGTSGELMSSSAVKYCSLPKGNRSDFGKARDPPKRQKILKAIGSRCATAIFVTTFTTLFTHTRLARQRSYPRASPDQRFHPIRPRVLIAFLIWLRLESMVPNRMPSKVCIILSSVF
ncbi:hypothetical protein CEXT_138261 [Caerostris extrusa]|uniref:Uncharacterized protein n=1 Tax=Caerostris extrusa TaxID=172846 RepID=A0AAV4Y1B6_CAEEX|nr:hypothetical protein CEXT_138261 [Caerostris extrusa]